jgi:DNA-directed RNA polymerase
MGKDKLPLADRVEYVDSNLDLILRCAAEPLKHTEWAELENAW